MTLYTAGDVTCCLYRLFCPPRFLTHSYTYTCSRFKQLDHNMRVCVCLCARWIASDHLAAQGGWFNLCLAGAPWLVNPWRAPSNGDVKGQVGTQMMWQPTKTSVSHHKHTEKTSVYMEGVTQTEHEILMTNITLYTHTDNKNGLCWRDYSGVSRGEMGWEECE